MVIDFSNIGVVKEQPVLVLCNADGTAIQTLGYAYTRADECAFLMTWNDYVGGYIDHIHSIRLIITSTNPKNAKWNDSWSMDDANPLSDSIDTKHNYNITNEATEGDLYRTWVEPGYYAIILFRYYNKDGKAQGNYWYTTTPASSNIYSSSPSLSYDESTEKFTIGTAMRGRRIIEFYCSDNKYGYIDEETYPNGLAAGTYYFTLPSDYDAEYGGGKTFNFTIYEGVPVGGQIRFNWGWQVQASDCNISTYAFAGSKFALETVSVTVGESGTALPAVQSYVRTESTNSIERSRYGSNDWLESPIRQMINSDEGALYWWEPTTGFDRPPEPYDVNAFLKCLDPAFLAVVGEVTKETALGSGKCGLNTSTERFFLLSRAEVYETNYEMGVRGADGTIYPYYKYVDGSRIKYTSEGTAEQWWLRSPYYYNGIGCTYVDKTDEGSVGFIAANNWAGIAPACVIV